jgi:glycosyltransferase involved in cell wall biosynthesis
VQIALDATYSLGKNLSGVGVYSRQILFGLARRKPDSKFLFYYRPHRLLRSLRDPLPRNVRRRILRGRPGGELFHALNQRVDIAGARTVTTFHDLFVLSGDYSSPEFRARFTEQARGAAERSDLIIAISEFTAHQIETLLKVERGRIRVIPHGVTIASVGTSQRENIVLFVGAIQKRKNVARLVQAFNAMPPGWRLVLAGAPNGWGSQEELRAVEQSSRQGDIEVAGYVSNEKLESLYRRARIFAFASMDEGFGMPALDAMAHGLPVITSNRSAMPEVVGDAALLVDPENVDELASALRLLALDEALREDLARRGRDRAAGFSWNTAVDRTWEVYQELLR